MTRVVAVHGVGLDHTMWEPWTLASRRAPIVTYDMLGHGDAASASGADRLAHYAQQLEDIVGDAPSDIVGFSMGALVAQRFALDHPARVRRLVLVSAVHARSPQERAAISQRVTDVERGGYLDTIEPALRRWFTDAFSRARPDVIDAVRRRMQLNDVAAYAAAYRVFATADAELAPLAEEVRAPTLVITGELDERSTPAMAHALAAAIPTARCEIVAGVRHLLPLESPEALARLTDEFLCP